MFYNLPDEIQRHIWSFMWEDVLHEIPRSLNKFSRKQAFRNLVKWVYNVHDHTTHIESMRYATMLWNDYKHVYPVRFRLDPPFYAISIMKDEERMMSQN